MHLSRHLFTGTWIHSSPHLGTRRTAINCRLLLQPQLRRAVGQYVRKCPRFVCAVLSAWLGLDLNQFYCSRASVWSACHSEPAAIKLGHLNIEQRTTTYSSVVSSACRSTTSTCRQNDRDRHFVRCGPCVT